MSAVSEAHGLNEQIQSAAQELSTMADGLKSKIEEAQALADEAGFASSSEALAGVQSVVDELATIIGGGSEKADEIATLLQSILQ